MDFGIMIKFISSILFVVMGLMAKYSQNDGWSSVKKYWIPHLARVCSEGLRSWGTRA
jgi:hypothetical protein